MSLIKLKGIGLIWSKIMTCPYYLQGSTNVLLVCHFSDPTHLN